MPPQGAKYSEVAYFAWAVWSLMRSKGKVYTPIKAHANSVPRQQSIYTASELCRTLGIAKIMAVLLIIVQICSLLVVVLNRKSENMKVGVDKGFDLF